MRKQKIWILILFIILALFSVRTILLTPGTIGHNWDWFVPASLPHLQHFASNLFYTWRNFSLGEPISLWLPSAPFFFFFTSFSFLGLGGDFISKFLIISTMVISGVGMFLLLENLLERKAFFASFLAGFFYAFSPFLFAEFIGGAATQFFAYALFPWFLFFTRCLNQEKKKFWFYLLLSSLILSLLTISLQVLVLASLTVFAYTLIQPKKLLFLKNLVFLYLAYFFLNLYWVLPSLVEYTNIRQTLSGVPSFSYFTIQNLVPFLTEAFVSAGYTRPFFLATIDKSIYLFWFSLTFLLMGFILGQNILVKKSKESLFWVLVFLFSLIFATGGKEPLGNQVVWLYQNFPAMALFRSPQHFLVLPVLATAILVGLAFSWPKSFLLKFFALALVFFWLHPFFLLGDLGSFLLRTKKMEHLDVYQLSPGYQKIFDLLSADREDFKVLFLPMSGSPYYLRTEYQNEGQGGDPLVEYSFRDTVVADISYGTQAKDLVAILEESFCQGKNLKALPQVLGILNIKYLILRKDVLPHFSPCREWDWQKTYQFLKSQPAFGEIKNEDYLVLMENKNFLPHFFVVDKIDTDQEAANLTPATNLPNLTFEKINPTLYQVKIQQAQKPYFLVFSESFNSSWKVYLNTGGLIIRWFVPPLFDGQHFKVNSFANAWYIDKKGDYELIIEYCPQRVFYLGGVLSSLFLVLLVSAAVKKIFK